MANQPTRFDGLSEAEARERLGRDGPNEPLAAPKQALVVQLLRRFANPLIGILILASVLSAVVGDVSNAAIICGMVTLGVVLEFLQTHRSQRAAEALRGKVALTAMVFREGAWKEVPRREIVRGDVIRLSAGDMIPADAGVLEARDLHVQEAALTGESLPVEKNATGDPASPS